MAEAILRSKNRKDFNVRSAGIYATEGLSIADNAKILIEEAGFPYTPHSNLLSSEDVKWADYIFTMTTSHKHALLQMFPEASKKIFTLKEFVMPGASPDVQDPFGGNLDVYRETFHELEDLLNKLNEKLQRE